MRAVALDVHRDFCEVAIVAEGRLRSAGRIKTRAGELELFAQSLDARDWVALEVTGNAWAIARILEAHVALQAQRAYEHTVADWQANKVGAGTTPGRASQRPSSGTATRQTHEHSPTGVRLDPHDLTFIRRAKRHSERHPRRGR